MTARLRAIGLATPERTFAQGETVEVLRRAGLDVRRPRAVQAIADRAGIARRGSVLIDDDGGVIPLGVGPAGTAERMRAYAALAAPLAGRAARDAMSRAEVKPAEITHLVTVSCTGFTAPGVEFALIESLALSPTVARTNVGFMGCHGAVNGLRVAKSYAESDRDRSAVVLVVCVELCTLHVQSADSDGAGVVNTLFADGAAAAVVSSSGPDDAPRLAATSSTVLPCSADQMSWNLGDHGFGMTLAPAVPETIAEHAPVWVDAWLRSEGLDRADVRAWALHPGGPRVLDRLGDALGLDERAVCHSRGVLRDHGNMSSPTLLAILRRTLDAEPAGLPAVGLAFGPGLVGEGVLLTGP